jgi:hypothetical protein
VEAPNQRIGACDDLLHAFNDDIAAHGDQVVGFVGCIVASGDRRGRYGRCAGQFGGWFLCLNSDEGALNAAGIALHHSFLAVD